jgi:hypothetical protein
MTDTPAKVYVTLSRLPLAISLEWPFHRSSSGADFWVLHTTIRLLSSPALHARASVNLSATLREVLPSLEPRDIEGPVVNALRKEADREQLEFLKSPKLVPVNFSSRHYDFKRNRWVFGKVSDEELAAFLLRKAFWQTRSGHAGIWLADPTEAQYVETEPPHLLEAAAKLAAQSLLEVKAEHATATSTLLAQSAKFEGEAQAALDELEAKHAFERG